MNKKQTSQIEVPVSDELAAKLKAWRQANPRATLTEIEEAVEAELAKVRKELVTELAQAGEESEGEAPHCPRCGQEMVRNGRRKRRLKSKEGQTLQLERQQWRCLECGTTLFPPG
jgi:transposase-like protein